ncbi:Ger(x)C family spore germination protein [Paenibacillus yanchengensis]|uniref:Ger(X)C family spore germination protein n=1 Tax=Paenibacillus yanchengensis TaxID=2035833 RepID=A0ABW4YQS0_9BACL
MMNRTSIFSIRFGALACLLILLLTITTGCWNRMELSEISVVLAMGIDKVEDQYQVSVQFVDPSQMSRNRTANRSPAVTISERASTVFEAVRKLTTKTSRRLYFSHLRLLVFDEKTAKEGIKNAMDLMFRDHEVRPDFYIAVAKKNTARDILAIVTPTEVLPAMDIDKSLIVSEKTWAPTAAINVITLLQTLMQDGKEPVLTGVSIIGNLEKSKTMQNVQNPLAYGEYKYEGLGVFKEEKLLGWLNESDSKAYTYIVNKVTSTVGVSKCPNSGGFIAIEVTEANTKIITNVENNKPSITLKMLIEGTINEVQCTINMQDPNEYEQMEQTARETFQTMIEKGIKTVQRKFGVDIFGFGEAFHRNHPKQWNIWKEQWDDVFKQLPVQIDLDYKLNKVGKIINPIDKEPDKER